MYRYLGDYAQETFQADCYCYCDGELGWDDVSMEGREGGKEVGGSGGVM